MDEEITFRNEEINELLADDNIQRAIARLFDLIRDFAYESELQPEAVLISANHNRLIREERGNRIDPDLARRDRSKIIYHIIKVQKDAEEYCKAKSKQQFSSAIPKIKDTKIIDKNDQINPELDYKLQNSRDGYFGQNLDIRSDYVFIMSNLTKEYKKPYFGLKNINIEIKKNEILGVIGENGNGKTTLFRILGGELKHDKGELKYPSILELDSNRLNWVKIKNSIAYVEQELPIWHGSLINTLYYEASCNNIQGENNKKQIDFIIHRLGLAEHLNKRWHQLSGGFKLRFSLAKALVKNPKLLVLDEPLANLDINATSNLLEDLRNLSNSLRYPVSIVLSSQHINEIEDIADKILFLKNGSQNFYGSKAELGKSRKYNFYEVQVSISKLELLEKLKNIKIIDIIKQSAYFQIITPINITSEDIVKEMLYNNILFTYFRDVSRSAKRLFSK